MVATALMGKKKPDEASSDTKPGNTAPGQKKDRTNVKVRAEFKRRLKIIAAAQQPEIDMGELIEKVMQTFMAREWEALTGRKWEAF